LLDYSDYLVADLWMRLDETRPLVLYVVPIGINSIQSPGLDPVLYVGINTSNY